MYWIDCSSHLFCESHEALCFRIPLLLSCLSVFLFLCSSSKELLTPSTFISIMEHRKRRKWRVKTKLVRSWEVWPYETFSSRTKEFLCWELRSNRQTLCHCFGVDWWPCPQHTSECWQIISPGKCHTSSWVGKNAGEVAVSLLKSSARLLCCSLSAWMTLSLQAPWNGLTMCSAAEEALEWLLATCLFIPLRKWRPH